MGLRELLWLLVGLLLVYVAFELYRAYRPGRGVAAARAVPAGSETAAAPARSDVFHIELEVQQLRRELADLRAEFRDQRRELTELDARIRKQKEPVEANTGSQGVSPEYNEALVYARRGLDVEAIAERCGITVAEAELVCSLARRGEPDPGSGTGT
jgi:hypothetical protein